MRCPRIGPTSPRAREFVRDLDADLGGTEIASALRAAYRIESEHGVPRDLLLITDGEVWDTDSTVAEARASGHRIFSVGVGSAVAEPFVRALAGATGGACELVTPRENMAARIHRHFQRILAPPAKRARVIWPAPVRHAVPDPLPPPYPGDTLHLFGSFAERPEGPVVLELELADGRTVSHRLELGAPPPGNAGVEGASGIRSDLARMGAARRLRLARRQRQPLWPCAISSSRSGPTASSSTYGRMPTRRPSCRAWSRSRKSWPPAGTASAPCATRRRSVPPPTARCRRRPLGISASSGPVLRDCRRSEDDSADERRRAPTWKRRLTWSRRFRPGPSAHLPNS